MKKITITVVFNVGGHGNIGLIPTHYNQWTVNLTGSRDFNLDPGNYTITYLTATDALNGGGSITIIEEGSKQLGNVVLKAGVDGGTIDITVV